MMPLAREAAAVERVHIQLAADRAVGVAASAAGENEREIGRRGARKLRRYARLDHAVARDYHAALRVDLRAVERMQTSRRSVRPPRPDICACRCRA